MKSNIFMTASIAALATVFAGTAAADPISDAAPKSLTLTGNTSFDGWNNLTAAANPGFPAFPGSGPWPNPIGSNVAGSGDADLRKISNSPMGGGATPRTAGIYFGGFSADPNVNGGTLAAQDATAQAGVKTVVFQVETGDALNFDFFNGVLPTLSYNGGSQALTATFSNRLERIQNGTMSTPAGEQPIYVNLWALQWDLSGIGGPINSLDVRWNGVQHSQVYALQLDQTDAVYTTAAYAPVPEPASMAALAMGAVALLRRKRAAKK